MATRAPEAMASRAGEAGMLAGIAWAPVAILVYFALQAASRVLAPGGLNLDEAEQMVAVQALDWINALEDVEMAEFRTDRFRAAVDASGGKFRLAYVVRAVSPGTF
ncbi:MAG: hypothetical protein AAFZ09_13050, partial [Pseudomonadota bacterium]